MTAPEWWTDDDDEYPAHFVYRTSSFGMLKQWHVGYLSDEDNASTVTMHMPTWRPEGLVISKEKFLQYAAKPDKLRVCYSEAWHKWGGQCTCLMDDDTYKTGIIAGGGDLVDTLAMCFTEGAHQREAHLR